MTKSINRNDKEKVQELALKFIDNIFFNRNYDNASKLVDNDIRFTTISNICLVANEGNLFESNKDFFNKLPNYISHGLINCNISDITNLLFECTININDIKIDDTDDFENMKVSVLIRINDDGSALVIKFSYAPILNSKINYSFINDYSCKEEKKASSLLKIIIDSYPYSIFWKDLKGRYLGVNKAVLEKYNFKDESEIIGKTDDLVFHDTNLNRDLFSESDEAVINKGIKSIGYFEETNCDNSNRYIQLIKTPLIENNTKVGVIGYSSDFTNLRNLEIANINIQKQLYYVLDNTNIGYFLKDKNLRYVKVNKAFANFTGYNKDYIIGKKEGEIKLPFSDSKIIERHQKALKDKKIISFKFVIPTDMGIKRTISVTEGPTLDNLSGDINGMFGFFEDISEIQNKQKFLEDKYIKAIDYLKTDQFISYLRIDLDDKRIIELSRLHCEDVKNIPYNEEFVNSLMEEILYEDEKAKFKKLYSVESLIKNFDSNTELTFQFLGKSTERKCHFNYFVRTKFVKNPMNNHREVVHYSFDQSDKVKKDELYKNISQKQYDFIAKFYVPFNFAVIISENSSDYSFSDIVVNKECKLDDLIKKIFSNSVLEDTDIPSFLELVKGDLQQQNSVCYSFCTKKNRRKSLKVEITNREKGILYVLGSDITEITEKDNLIKLKLEAAVNKAQKANEIKSEFLARMSHDMRTPLNGIIGLANFGDEEDDISILKDYLSKIRYSGNYLLALLNDVLDVQSFEKGKIKFTKRPCSLEGNMIKLVELVKQRANEKSITIDVDIPKLKDIYVNIDIMRARQVIVNILSNAIKYTPNEGNIKFTGKLIKKDGLLTSIIIEIKDNGVGMSEEFQKHMYESFTSEANEHSIKEGGTGLGLSIVYSLMSLLGGKIECTSELSVGTTFVLTFPIELVSKDSYEKFTGNKQLLKPENKIEGKKILVCEDNSINRLVLNKILSDEKAIITFAKDGFEGVNQCNREKFNIVLMDIRMPVMNGLEATKRIRNFDTKIPIIALSANAYKEDIENSIKSGMNAHLSKPIDKKKLIETINKFL